MYCTLLKHRALLKSSIPLIHFTNFLSITQHLSSGYKSNTPGNSSGNLISRGFSAKILCGHDISYGCSWHWPVHWSPDWHNSPCLLLSSYSPPCPFLSRGCDQVHRDEGFHCTVDTWGWPCPPVSLSWCTAGGTQFRTGGGSSSGWGTGQEYTHSDTGNILWEDLHPLHHHYPFHCCWTRPGILHLWPLTYWSWYCRCPCHWSPSSHHCECPDQGLLSSLWIRRRDCLFLCPYLHFLHHFSSASSCSLLGTWWREGTRVGWCKKVFSMKILTLSCLVGPWLGSLDLKQS